MENQTENDEEGSSARNNKGCISGTNSSNNTISYNETVYKYANRNEEGPVRNITLNCLSSTSCFKGRTEILQTIEKYFTNKTHNIVVIHGAPGIGKTETARQFAVEKSEYFNGNLIWVFSETEENLKKCFKDLSVTLGLQVTDVSQVYSRFTSSQSLFVFDNVEKMGSIKNYLPPTHLREKVKVLITSQFSEWDSSVAKVPLEPLNPENALEIFKDKLKDKHFESHIEMIKDLVVYLEGIPLSIQIVSSIVKEELSKVRIKFNLQQFICGLKGNFINFEIPDFEIFNYNKTVFSSIRFALERLKKEENPSYSLDLLRFVAYLDADGISHEDLLLIPSIEKSTEKLETALTKLRQYSLIQVEHVDDDDRLKIKIHRTIQHVLRKYDLNEQNGSMFKTVLKTLLSGKMFFHFDSIFKYVKEDEFQDKSVKFYDENYIENRSLTEAYLKKLAYYKCDRLLLELLPKFEDKYVGTGDNYNKILNKLLYWAIINRYNDLLTINLLINFGAKIEVSFHDGKTNGIHLASSWLSIELFDCLLESNDSKTIIHSKDFLGRTILHLLVEKCNEENMDETIKCMEHLISKWKAYISIRDNLNNTILHVACNNKNICLKMIKALVEKCRCKNIVNDQTKLGLTPLQYLLRWNNSNPELFEMVTYLINKCQTDLTIQDNNNWNTVFYVCRYGTLKIIDFVLKTRNCREFINSQDIKGNIAFTQLICNNRIRETKKIELTELFIENKMDFRTTNIRNETLVEIAEKRLLMKLSDELKKHLKVRRSFCILRGPPNGLE